MINCYVEYYFNKKFNLNIKYYIILYNIIVLKNILKYINNNNI